MLNKRLQQKQLPAVAVAGNAGRQEAVDAVHLERKTKCARPPANGTMPLKAALTAVQSNDQLSRTRVPRWHCLPKHTPRAALSLSPVIQLAWPYVVTN
jgi:hypothetical protein